MTAGRMRIACWITKATDTHTHTEYVIFIAFPLQQWLHKHASMLRHTTLPVLLYYYYYYYYYFIKLVTCLTMTRVWTLNLNKFRNKIPRTPKAMQNNTAAPATERTASRLQQGSRALVLLLGCRPAKPYLVSGPVRNHEHVLVWFCWHLCFFSPFCGVGGLLSHKGEGEGMALNFMALLSPHHTIQRKRLTWIIYTDPHVVGPCHHGTARPQVADRRTASDKEGSCE